MLENLDSVDWGNISHAYGSAKNVPDMLRALDEANSHEQFDNTYYELWNEVNHQGTLYEATAPTMHFIIQMLAKTTDAYRKMAHLIMLSEMLRSTQQYSSGISLSRFYSTYSITRLKVEFDLYAVISEGIDHYLNLLSDESEDVQAASAYVLSYLVEHHERIFPALLGCMKQAKGAWLQAGIVWSYANLAKSAARYAPQPYIKQLRLWIEQDTSLHVRYAAALGYLMLSSYLPDKSNTVAEIVHDVIAQGLEQDTWKTELPNTNRLPDYGYSKMTPFNEATEIISIYCQSKFRPFTWAAIIPNMTLSPAQAHVYCREMLDIAFARRDAQVTTSHWLNHDYVDMNKQHDSFIYSYNKFPKRYQEGNLLTDSQEMALKTVVECEPFWEVPTNIFSFLYGLPDEREALRKLLE